MLNSDRMVSDTVRKEGSLLVGGPLRLAALGLGLTLSLLLLVAGHGADCVLHNMTRVLIHKRRIPGTQAAMYFVLYEGVEKTPQQCACA